MIWCIDVALILFTFLYKNNNNDSFNLINTAVSVNRYNFSDEFIILLYILGRLSLKAKIYLLSGSRVRIKIERG